MVLRELQLEMRVMGEIVACIQGHMMVEVSEEDTMDFVGMKYPNHVYFRPFFSCSRTLLRQRFYMSDSLPA